MSHFDPDISQDAKDTHFMAEALRLAKKGRFTAHPNPRVGCVLVKNDQIVGQGWHRKSGEAHAEVHALRQAGLLAEGACAYVTLEPCSHFGKTPPCANALIEAGVKRVVVATEDPNPQVAGRGLVKLEMAGVQTKLGVLREQARNLNKGFIKRMEKDLPWVSIKMAMSVDGRTAMASGESQWITGPSSRSDVQRLRAESSAILTGIGTLLEDDAALTVRAEQFDIQRFEPDVKIKAEAGFDGVTIEELLQNQPLRVLFDSRGRLPSDAKLLKTGGPLLWVISEGFTFTSDQQKIADLPFVEILSLAELYSENALRTVLQHLAHKGCNEVMVEAGSKLAGSFVSANLYDELVIYMAPKLLGSNAKSLFSLPIDKMLDAKALTLLDLRQFGDDVRFIYRSCESSAKAS